MSKVATNVLHQVHPFHKFGRIAPNAAHFANSLKLKSFLKAIPAHPVSEDYAATLNGGWQMLGNDQYGDCVAVGWANLRRLI